MPNQISSDLSMNWAIDSFTGTKRSAREVFNNPHLKEANRYVCIGCVELANHLILDHEKNKGKTLLEHVSHDEHPFFRRGKKQQHYERCRFRDPDTTVISLAKENEIVVDDRTKVLRILTSARLIRKIGTPYGYSRRANLKFFTYQPHQKFYYFLSTLLKDYEMTTIRHHLASFSVETETGERVKFADLFGFQDDVIKQIEKYTSACLAIVIGTVREVLHRGHILIKFTTSTDEENGNTKPFQLFIHKDDAIKIGDIHLLENQKIACYGFAEKKLLTHGFVYQMDLYSIQHQVFFFDKQQTLVRIDLIDQPDDPAGFVIQECVGFASQYWGIYRMKEREIKELLTNFEQAKKEKLQSKQVQEELKWKTFEEFMNDWNNKNQQMEKYQQEFEEYHNVLQEVKAAHKSKSVELFSKLGFNRKRLRKLELEIAKLERQIKDKEQVVINIKKVLGSNSSMKAQWDQWYQSQQVLEQELYKVEQNIKKEEDIKRILAPFRSQLFFVPIKHAQWNLIIGFSSNLEDEQIITVTAIVQLYAVRNQAWLSADHYTQKQVIEYKVNIRELNSSPREAVKGFYSKLGNFILERIMVLGWPTPKCKCPICSSSMKLQKYKDMLYLKCWNSNCSGKYELAW
jgi:hypothetical protein